MSTAAAPEFTDGSVTIRVDASGVPHISADDAAGVFYGQGYAAAGDRLFQMDLWLRRGLGRLAEAFGQAWVTKDHASRLFLYRGDPADEADAYGRWGPLATTAFAAGINAFIADAEQAGTLPPEFARYDYRPLAWTGSDISRLRTHGLFENALQELARTTTIRRWGTDVEDLRRLRRPNRPLPHHPTDVDEHALDVYALAFAPVNLDDPSMQRSATITADGSNNWVLAGTKTASGRPLLANDPHRAMGLPALRYVTHLTCPEFDVIGAGEPFLPGVSIGHNRHVAFGLTIFPTDQEDLLSYELDDNDPERYRYDGRWYEFELVEEVIAVRGGGTEHRLNRYSIHGPVTHHSAQTGVAVAVRAAWLQSGMAPYLNSLRYLDVTTSEEFVASLSRWGAPTVNHVFADTAGTIGWQASGTVPARTDGDGLTPTSGDAPVRWARMRGTTDLPGRIDPDSGWLASANQYNLTDDDCLDPPGFEWLAPYRYERIAERLGASDDWTVRTTMNLQNDLLSIPGRRICAALRHEPLTELSGNAVTLLRCLHEWDQLVTSSSVGAAVFETWFRGALRRALYTWKLTTLGVDDVSAAVTAVLPDDREEASGDAQTDLALFTELRTTDRLRFVGIIQDTLDETFARLTEQLGPDPADWRWGRLHTMQFQHAATTDWDLPPVAKSGSPDTVGVSSRRSDGAQTAGASFRFVADVGNWDNCWFVNAPGQSGVPGTAHYADHVQAWQAGDYFRLAYSDTLVDTITDHTYTLHPTRESASTV